MAEMKVIVLAAILTACGSTSENPLFLTGHEAGVAGAVGIGGSAGWPETGGAGAGGAAGSTDAAVCPDHMIAVGNVCVDDRPALLGDGSQGPAVSWSDALAICTARGLRICREAERELGCPGGQISSNGTNSEYCSGPANTWEWSGAECTNTGGHCLSPCCNAVLYPCKYDACDTGLDTKQSYRCCRDL